VTSVFACHCHLLVTIFAAHGAGHHLSSPSSLLSENLPLGLAGVSASMGAIVVVFVAFAFQAIGHESVDELDHRERLPFRRWHAARELLIQTSAVAMVGLLLTPLFLLYNLASHVLNSETTIIVAIGIFSFSVTTLIVGLLIFFVVPPAPRTDTGIGQRNHLGSTALESAQ
jgi:hypothetical protein